MFPYICCNVFRDCPMVYSYRALSRFWPPYCRVGKVIQNKSVCLEIRCQVSLIAFNNTLVLKEL